MEFDDLKKNWQQAGTGPSLTKESLRAIVRKRTSKQKSLVMKYFWAAFVLQIIVYAMLAHLLVKYYYDPLILAGAIAGTLAYLPFTVMLMTKYKKMAILRFSNEAQTPVRKYVRNQRKLLLQFFRFKKAYELFLIPFSSALLIWIFFRIYIPGGVASHPGAAWMCFLLTLGSCAVAIIAENRRNFLKPLKEYEMILAEFEEHESRD